jgi:hypothetical protein
VVDTDDSEDEEDEIFGATWVVLGSSRDVLNAPVFAKAGPISVQPGFRLWTDQYSNLFQILR